MQSAATIKNDADEDPSESVPGLSRGLSLTEDYEKNQAQIESNFIHDVLLIKHTIFPLVLCNHIGEDAHADDYEDRCSDIRQVEQEDDDHCVDNTTQEEGHWVHQGHVMWMILL